MLNHIVLMGRLTRDPELRRTGSGLAVASFSLAVDRDFGNRETGERETDFIDIVAWRSSAEFVSKYFAKGRMAVVSGRLQIRNWTDKEGNKRRSAEVVADSVYFGDSKRDSQGTESGYSAQYGAPAPQYGASAPQYSAQPSQGSFAAPYGGYSAPAAPSAVSDFAMLEEDDGHLPF